MEVLIFNTTDTCSGVGTQEHTLPNFVFYFRGCVLLFHPIIYVVHLLVSVLREIHLASGIWKREVGYSWIEVLEGGQKSDQAYCVYNDQNSIFDGCLSLILLSDSYTRQIYCDGKGRSSHFPSVHRMSQELQKKHNMHHFI